MFQEFKRSGPLMDIRSYPAWAADVLSSTQTAKEKVVKHPLFLKMRDGNLPLQQTRQFLLAGWPVIEQFPQYMAVNLCKVQYGRSAGENMARKYLMSNIRVEQNHADHWVEWAMACGVSKHELIGASLPVESQALNHWCWHSCKRDSLATSMAATNLAIEGATGEWSRLICSTDTYEKSFESGKRKKATRWLKLHALYDDTHPWEALEIICTLIGEIVAPKYAKLLSHCVANSYDYMALSLDRCLLAAESADVVDASAAEVPARASETVLC